MSIGGFIQMRLQASFKKSKNRHEKEVDDARKLAETRYIKLLNILKQSIHGFY